MARLFAAIDLGQAARDRIAAEQHRLAAALHGAALRWVRPEHLHLTLVFVGEVADDCAARLVNVMQQKIARRPFRFELGGFGVFPPRGAPRALWLGVRTGVEDLVVVQQEVAARCEALGMNLDPRPFHPHVTLARWRDRRKSTRPHELGASRDIVATTDVNAITLFESRLSSDGPTYTVLVESHLTGPSVAAPGDLTRRNVGD
jgi:2'-5' RNA ligase